MTRGHGTDGHAAVWAGVVAAAGENPTARGLLWPMIVGSGLLISGLGPWWVQALCGESRGWFPEAPFSCVLGDTCC